MSMTLSLALAFAVGAPGIKQKEQAKGPGYLGIRLKKEGDGLLVTDVMKNSPALDAGLKPDDVIMKIDSESMKDADTADLIKIVAGMRPGTVVPIEVKRGELTLTVKVKLAARPPDFEQMNPRVPQPPVIIDPPPS